MARYHGQMTNASRHFHQMSFAKAMVNIQPAAQNTPALPEVTLTVWGLPSDDIFSSKNVRL